MKRAIKKVVRENPATSTVVLAGIGTIAAVGLLWWAVERNAAAAPALSAPSSSNSVALQPGPMTIRVAQGATVTGTIPNGGQIVSSTQGTVFGSAQGTTGTTAVEIQPTTTGFATIVWNDAKGVQQTTTLNYTVVNESGQTV